MINWNNMFKSKGRSGHLTPAIYATLFRNLSLNLWQEKKWLKKNDNMEKVVSEVIYPTMLGLVFHFGVGFFDTDSDI